LPVRPTNAQPADAPWSQRMYVSWHASSTASAVNSGQVQTKAAVLWLLQHTAPMVTGCCKCIWYAVTAALP
jgi:hypothetical protein